MGENPEAVVIHVGSEVCRVGVAGEDDPREVFSSFTGRKVEGEGDVLIGVNMDKEDKESLLFTPCMERGIVTDWDLLEKIYDYTFTHSFKDLNDLNYRPLMVAETPLTPPEHTQKNKEILFEKFNAPALFFAVDAVLSLYATGRVCGLVVEGGAAVTNVVPIFEGVAVPHSIARIELGGRDVSDYMMGLVGEENDTWAGLGGNTVQEIKEKLGYIATNFAEEEQKEIKDEIYELPDGKKVVVGRERYRCGELLFNPEGAEGGDLGRGLGGVVISTALKFEEEVGRELAKNIVLSGGGTLMTGFGERLEKDLEREIVGRWAAEGGVRGSMEGGEGKCWEEKLEFKLDVRENRQQLAYLGGSILSSLGSFSAMWLAKEQYEEEGKDRKEEEAE
mmetsp:Transcript_7365/g.11084  ORF Transcript_7365/g.11084 Transcript_7365/m.11084 type:complete len:391 (-) Transcript_7365:1397-2569(-)|eukprot:CAMPEP_0201507970 /NCGR_PEP_ID=MMETSP0161_2-20130828/1449_1 /ASSEMBLY_ACC=CAM_ASM_000251 /TAXON_ID=180227 /ORGANISM="Neoparamoeba aestuarina, Strain SoJaBio B1-5/56/2" /LENGTH=390 /DNA_ID=CAMNT_0047902469 /DNA_START=151 /DNA_END=1323 /DNA_ORIENTATION=+